MKLASTKGGYYTIKNQFLRGWILARSSLAVKKKPAGEMTLASYTISLGEHKRYPGQQFDSDTRSDPEAVAILERQD
jgi:hypothetical protein